MTREEAIDIIKCLAWHTRPDEEMIEQAIKALEQEPKIGHWTDDGYCSCCNKQTFPLDISGYASGYDSFCPNCGAKMESEG